MKRFRCKTCGGEYDERQADGTLYFHSCPPVTLVRAIMPDGDEEERPLAAFAGFAIAESDEHKKEMIKAGVDEKTIAVERGRRYVERADRRDENTLRRDVDKDNARIVKREGKGRDEIAARPAPEETTADAL